MFHRCLQPPCEWQYDSSLHSLHKHGGRGYHLYSCFQICTLLSTTQLPGIDYLPELLRFCWKITKVRLISKCISCLMVYHLTAILSVVWLYTVIDIRCLKWQWRSHHKRLRAPCEWQYDCSQHSSHKHVGHWTESLFKLLFSKPTTPQHI